ncbi:MAG: SGNH/GDSL hydrolase N-terminal domain-containing protein, partial [Bacillota bacterium]|nr:SGNH/GDSL hydrolase N-terminal domain-containing protein [Bacillota bacterium]
MIYRSLKDPKFRLYGSDVLDEPGFHRLSAAERERLKTVNPDAAWHAHSSTGILAKFITDSNEIRVRVKLLMPASMEYMSAVGQCGVDLYVQTEDGRYRLLDVSRFDAKASEYEAGLGRFQDGKRRRYILHLPIYMGATDVTIGLDDEAFCSPVDYAVKGRVAVYGTSIVQGGCVS